MSAPVQNLGIFHKDYAKIVEAVQIARARRKILNYTLLNHKLDPKFPFSGFAKILFYCVTADSSRLYVAAASDKNNWQAIAERDLYKRIDALDCVVKPLYIEMGECSQYLIFDLYEWGNLSEFLNDHKHKMTPMEIAWVVYSVVNTMAECHKLKIVLRDFKPENILVRRSSDGAIDVKLTDFGMAIYLPEASAEERERSCGTFAYFSPEMFAGIAISNSVPSADFPIDLWMLGVSLFMIQEMDHTISEDDLDAFVERKVVPPIRDFAAMQLGLFGSEIKDLLQVNPSSRSPTAWIAKRVSDIFLRTFPDSPVADKVKLRPKMTLDQILDSLKTVKTKAGERIYDKIAAYLRGVNEQC